MSYSVEHVECVNISKTVECSPKVTINVRAERQRLRVSGCQKLQQMTA